MEPQKLSVSLALMQAIVNYLQEKPHKEVYDLLEAIKKEASENNNKGPSDVKEKEKV